LERNRRKKRHFVQGTAEIIHSRSVSLATSGWTRKRFAETNVRHATSISERQKQVWWFVCTTDDPSPASAFCQLQSQLLASSWWS